MEYPRASCFRVSFSSRQLLEAVMGDAVGRRSNSCTTCPWVVSKTHDYIFLGHVADVVVVPPLFIAVVIEVVPPCSVISL